MSIIYGIISFLLCAILVIPVRRLALRTKIVDTPAGERKIHKTPTPLLGGVAVFLSFWLVLGGVLWCAGVGILKTISLSQVAGVFVASVIIMIFGYLDDKYRLRPWQQLSGSILAVAVALGFGIGVRFITNPFGGILRLDQFFWGDGIFGLWLIFPANLVTFGWILGTMYTTKVLDGLDGLVSGIAAIGGILIFLFATLTKYLQPDVAAVAIIFAGACLGFLAWNFYPAKIFLGEGGSLFAGFMLGVLAVIAGGKIAIALLVIGIPALDMLWVILRRVFWEKHSLALADRKHLHFRLLDLGMSERQVVLTLYLFSALFGGVAIFLQSKEKLIAVGVLVILMVILSILTIVFTKRDRKQ